MSRIEKAILVAMAAHSGQLDKGGQPYILHPLRIACNFNHESEVIVAILHDVLEDSDISIEEIIDKVSLTEEEVSALNSLTRKDGEVYLEYIHRLSKNRLASKIKIKDIKDNLDERRMPRGMHIPSLRKRYNKALFILENR